MRDFLVFDLGETLINFNKPGKKWYTSLEDDVIPRMYDTVKRNNDYFINNRITLEDFSTIAYKAITQSDKFSSMIERIAKFLSYYNIPNQKTLIEYLLNDFYNSLISTATIYNEVTNVLSKLKKQGYQLGLWSNTPWQSPGSLMEKIMKYFGIRKFFATTLFSGDHGIRKPNPLTFNLVLKYAKQKKSHMVYIGNAEVDIITGSKFEIPTIWVNRDRVKLSDNCPFPIFTIQNLEELFKILPIH